MENKWNERIDQFIQAQRENILRDIGRLVAVPSVEGPAAPGAPFGPGPRAALDEALAILKKHGERTEMRYEAPVLSPNMPPIPLSTAPLEIPTRCGGVVLFVLDVAQSARY